MGGAVAGEERTEAIVCSALGCWGDFGVGDEGGDERGEVRGEVSGD